MPDPSCSSSSFSHPALDLLGPVLVAVLTGHNAWLLSKFSLPPPPPPSSSFSSPFPSPLHNVITMLLLVIIVMGKEAIQWYSLAS